MTKRSLDAHLNGINSATTMVGNSAKSEELAVNKREQEDIDLGLVASGRKVNHDDNDINKNKDGVLGDDNHHHHQQNENNDDGDDEDCEVGEDEDDDDYQHHHEVDDDIVDDIDEEKYQYQNTEIRKLRRVMANRRSARESRERRKKLVEDLQKSVDKLAAENNEIAQANRLLQQELMVLIQHSGIILPTSSTESTMPTPTTGPTV